MTDFATTRWGRRLLGSDGGAGIQLSIDGVA